MCGCGLLMSPNFFYPAAKSSINSDLALIFMYVVHFRPIRGNLCHQNCGETKRPRSAVKPISGARPPLSPATPTTTPLLCLSSHQSSPVPDNFEGQGEKKGGVRAGSSHLTVHCINPGLKMKLKWTHFIFNLAIIL